MYPIMSLRAFRFLPCWFIAGLLLASPGCTFDSSLRDVACETEGDISQGRLCEGGRWIQIPNEEDATVDANPPIDIVGEDIKPPTDTTGADIKPPSDATGADTRPPLDAVGEDIRPPSDAVGEDTEPPSDVADADTEPPSDAADADTEPPADVIDDIQQDVDTRECDDGTTRYCVPEPPGGTTDCRSGIQTCVDGHWSTECTPALSAVQCSDLACLDRTCEADGADGICYAGACCSKPSDQKLVETLCINGFACGEMEVLPDKYCGESGHTIGCGTCSDGMSCQNNACCSQTATGTNRCIGKPCSTHIHCASGYCETNIDESITHQRCAPSHCNNGGHDMEVGETDTDCGGPCKKCALGQFCNDDDDCISDKCKKSNGQKTCIPD